MRKSPVVVMALVVLLLAGAFLAVAGASWSTTFIYTKFSTTDTTAIALDDTYSSWSFVVYNHLTYVNATSEAKLIFSNTTEAAKEGLMLTMKQAGVADGLKVYYKVGDSDIELASATWDADDEVTCHVSSGLLSVTLYDNSTDSDVAVLEDFAFSVDISAICASASAASGCSAGYVNVVSGYGIAGGSGGMTSTITEWLPIILEFAIIGMIFGMVKKFGWGVHR